MTEAEAKLFKRVCVLTVLTATDKPKGPDYINEKMDRLNDVDPYACWGMLDTDNRMRVLFYYRWWHLDLPAEVTEWIKEDIAMLTK